MEAIEKLSAGELIQNTRDLCAKEREITLQVIEHLQEIERRRLFSERGYSSLFEMCIKEFGYSESQAQRRISSMRLSKEIPEVKEAIQSGALNLATVSMAQQFFRQEKKSGHELDLDEKREVLRELEGKSKREAERFFSEESSTPPTTTTRVVLELTAEQLAKLEKLRALLSHQISPQEYEKLIEKLSDLALERLDPEVRAANRQAKPLVPGKVTRHIPAALRDQVWVRAQGCCEYVDPLTKRRCSGTQFLEVDHRKAIALGGTHDEENLRLLCKAHNIHHAVQDFGKEYMGNWVG